MAGPYEVLGRSETRPWLQSGLEPESLRLERIRDVLSKERDSEGRRDPGVQDRWTPGRDAAVLVSLFEEEGDTKTVLTRRSRRLQFHSGEISFPGGRAEPADEGPVATALREAQEEIGIDPRQVEPLALLQPVSTASSRVSIRPVVAELRETGNFVPEPAEVDEIVVADLATLAFGGGHRSELWRVGSIERVVHFFELPDGTVVWGATAKILVDLFSKLSL